MLTKYGAPTPWRYEEAQVYLAKVRNELDAGYHCYQKAKRVWAQKPFDEQPNAEVKVGFENLATGSDGGEKSDTTREKAEAGFQT